MKNFERRPLNGQPTEEFGEKFEVYKINKQIETKNYVLKSVEKILANKIVEQEEEILAHNLIEQDEQITDYTDEEKAEIDEMMKKVNLIDSKIEERKSIHGSTELGVFLIGYRNSTPRVKKHFEKIYQELSIIRSTQKIEHLLDTPFVSSGLCDVKNISIHVSTILEFDPKFDFSIFKSDELNKIILEIKKYNND